MLITDLTSDASKAYHEYLANIPKVSIIDVNLDETFDKLNLETLGKPSQSSVSKFISFIRSRTNRSKIHDAQLKPDDPRTIFNANRNKLILLLKQVQGNHINAGGFDFFLTPGMDPADIINQYGTLCIFYKDVVLSIKYIKLLTTALARRVTDNILPTQIITTARTEQLSDNVVDNVLDITPHINAIIRINEIINIEEILKSKPSGGNSNKRKHKTNKRKHKTNKRKRNRTQSRKKYT